ncbi:sigma factor, partial [Arthrospira platensis SPKY1]|nr:sigma factor [Arthrospira platensis SPKY1]
MSSSAYASSSSVELVYRDNHNWLQGWLRRRLGNASEAADLAHDTFIRLLRSPQQFDSQPAARAYLRVVANGLCIDLWRHREIE